jgi:fructoselysine-6-P-deglycase FrlB-like protein
MMNSLLRSMLLVGFAGILLVGCGAADKAADAAADATEAVVESADAVTQTASDAAAAVGEAVSSEPGGYVPTDEERVPGITE